MATIRRPGAASAAVLIGLTASMVGAHLVAPEWSRRRRLDVWNYAAAADARRAAADEWADVNGRAERAAARRAVADQFAARLVTGDAPLATVAAELLDLFGRDAGFQTSLAFNSPGVRDPHLRHAGHAIERVRRMLPDPAQRDAVVARLKADYRALTAARGAE